MNNQHDALSYSPADAAVALGMSKAQLYIEVAAGRIRARKFGRRTLIERSEMLRWLNSLNFKGRAA